MQPEESALPGDSSSSACVFQTHSEKRTRSCISGRVNNGTTAMLVPVDRGTAGLEDPSPTGVENLMLKEAS